MTAAPRVLFMSDFGDPEKDKGTLFVIQEGNGTDENPRVSFRLRRMPDGLQRKVEAKHGRAEQTTSDTGFKRPQMTYATPEALRAVLIEKADWVWTDAENLWINVEDDEARDFYRRHLADPSIECGALKLDGRLNTPIKRRLFEKDENLVGWILAKEKDLEAEYVKKQRELAGN